MRVREAMIPNPLVVPPTTTCLEFIHAVLSANQTTAAVVADGELVGMVSVRDIFTHILPHYVDMDERLANVIHEGFFEEKFEKLKQTPVGDVMTTQVDGISPDAEVILAVAMFVRLDRKTLPVIEGGKYVGSITRRSVLTTVTERATS